MKKGGCHGDLSPYIASARRKRRDVVREEVLSGAGGMEMG